MELKKCLQQVLLSKDLSAQKLQVKELSSQLNISLVDCAAALAYLIETETSFANPNVTKKINNALVTSAPIKMLRYQLDIGRKHQVSIEILKQCLVEESGVDYNNIGYIDLHYDYCLVKLPNEMPADIFQHLQTVEINQQKLNIRRYSHKQTNKRYPPKNNQNQINISQ